MQDILTAAEAANLLGCEPETICEKLNRGELPGVKFGRGWAIPRTALLETINDLARRNITERRLPPPIAPVPASLRGRKRNPPPVLPPFPKA
jgi:excisionase family DNA binding protein